MVVALGICGGGADRRAAVIQQGDGHALDAGFACVLDAIAISVGKDTVADAAEVRHITGVHI